MKRNEIEETKWATKFAPTFYNWIDEVARRSIYMDTRPGWEEDVRGRTTFGRAVDIADGNFGAGRERCARRINSVVTEIV